MRSKGPATGKKPPTKPASRKTTPKRKNPNKTKNAKASGKTRKSKTSSEPSSRANASPSKEIRDEIAQTLPQVDKPRMGRPKDSPDVWTSEHIAEVADQMWAYIQDTDIPLLSEFCSMYHVRIQRIGEFPELSEMREALQAKMNAAVSRAGLSLKTGEGPRGAFIAKLAANTGPHSLVDKLETESKSTVVTSYAIPDNGREGRG